MSLFESASLVVTPNGTKASKLYSVKPTDGSGDMTVVRATTATRVNSSGLIESSEVNVPRLDYTGSTCPSLLVEPQRTNVLTYSEQFDNAIWGKSNCTISANLVNSPDGTQDADKIVENTTNTGKYVGFSAGSLTAATTYTFSAFFKPDNCDVIGFREAAVSGSAFTYKFSTNTQSIQGTGWSNIKIEDSANGFKRISAIFTASTTSSSYNFRIHLLGNSYNQTTNTSLGTYTYLGDGASGIYVWGAQFEAGSNATSYIPTTTASVTRNADLIYKTGITDLISQTEGTMFFNGKINSSFGSRSITLSDGTTSNRVILSFGNNATNRIEANLILAGVSQTSGLLNTLNITNDFKMAFSYAENSFKLFVNGVKVAQDLSGSTFSGLTLNQIHFANNNGTSQFMDSYVKSVLLFKTALTETECITLTTL